MKKIWILSILFLLALSLSNAIADDTTPSDPVQRPDAPYRLFRTANMWTFIKLNTQDGRIWLISFDVKGDNRGTYQLSDKTLIDTAKRLPGRFTLYPTANIYTFILVDQVDGRTWQVQWAFDPDDRGIMPIPGVDE